MKWIAFIFLVIFTVVQTAPAVNSICKDLQVSIFNPDEEKAAAKVNGNSVEECKEKKICYYSFAIDGSITMALNIVGFQGNKDKLPLPVLDMITPPPNYA